MERLKPPRLLQRRVATAPTLLLQTHHGEKGERDVDTIFNHTNAKVISLVALSDQTFSLESSSRDTIGPWQSHFERIIAIGPLRLYRAPGSVAFLSCGSALQPIFPKSQCWCMEENGNKFILQIRPPSYWRIELASPNPPGDRSLRDSLASVLLLDKTPCPFKESVPISLPPESLTVRKRRPWKPLRSYPSEPILSESGDTCADSQPFKEGWNGGAKTEHQSERPSTTEQEKDEEDGPGPSKVPMAPNSILHSTSEDSAVQAAIALEDKPRAIERLTWQTARKQNPLGVEAKFRRRHSIGSSWHDAQTEAFPEELRRDEASTSLHDSQPKKSETEVLNETWLLKGRRYHRAQRQAPVQQLRLRRKDLGDASKNAFTVEAGRHSREPPPPLTDTDLFSRPPPADSPLLRAVFSIFYAIFSIFVMAFETAGTTVINWCKHVNDAQRTNLPSQT